ncbi:esterase/lipase family protein [Vulcanococcus limneticus]|uniref:esterase/lipase family protein n=1 Tax=Vulcanococcus limneticus TaxID=2170428 RepID=UPI00398C0399
MRSSSGSTQTATPPLVLLHGLMDSPRVFDRLRRHLGEQRQELLVPDLPVRFGTTPVQELAEWLGRQIEAAFGPSRPVDLLGFSMGGVIGRTWIQLQGGYGRTRRFISLGSPQQGTLTAQPWPRKLLAGIADLKPGSPLLQRLDADLDSLRQVDCCSFYSGLDLMVLPGWSAVLPVGPRHQLPVLTHPQLVRDPQALAPLAQELLRA